MHRFLSFILLAWVIPVAVSSVTASPVVLDEPMDSLLDELDRVIARRDDYLQAKQARIGLLYRELAAARDDRARFDVLGGLFDEYHSFDADSAYSVSERQYGLARKIGDPALMLRGRLNRANLLSAIGLSHEAFTLLDSIEAGSVPPHMRAYYYHTLRTLYGRMADFAPFTPEKARYEALTDRYRDSLLMENPPGSLAHELIKADRLNVHGKPSEAVRVLEDFISRNDLSDHEKAICAWTFAESYLRLKDDENRKRQLAVSAISDIKSSVREYAALRELALMLHREGDAGRAYRYMTVALDDAAKCSARQRIVELNDVFPMVNGIYLDIVNRQKKTLERTVLIITVLSLLLLVMLVHLRRQMRRMARGRRELEASYDKLHQLNSQLLESSEKLAEANASIVENSRLKEVYIGRYMEQCLVYIAKLDSFRKMVNKLLAAGKTDELRSMVKPGSQSEKELKQFYDKFDRTFLSLFPRFVDEFNSLLLPGEAIVPKKDGYLTPELRIFALVRLGVTDSEDIARFLGYSLTTIYNYRTKVRNKALGDRGDLEARVARIGHP